MIPLFLKRGWIMFFLDNQHYERFNKLVSSYKIEAERERHFKSCFYIFSKSQKLFDISEGFISNKNIDFMNIDFSFDFSVIDRLFISLANNLFNNTKQINVLELIPLDDINFKIAITAINIRRNLNYESMDFNSSGRPKKINPETVKLMKKEGLTQEEISKLLGVSLSTVKRNWN